MVVLPVPALSYQLLLAGNQKQFTNYIVDYNNTVLDIITFGLYIIHGLGSTPASIECFNLHSDTSKTYKLMFMKFIHPFLFIAFTGTYSV